MRVTIHVFTTRITIIRIIFIPGLVAFSHLALSKHQLTILFLFALTVTLNLTVKLLDFKRAFLHSVMPQDMPVYFVLGFYEAELEVAR